MQPLLPSLRYSILYLRLVAVASSLPVGPSGAATDARFSRDASVTGEGLRTLAFRGSERPVGYLA